jgi:hypothetical protein
MILAEGDTALPLDQPVGVVHPMGRRQKMICGWLVISDGAHEWHLYPLLGGD